MSRCRRALSKRLTGKVGGTSTSDRDFGRRHAGGSDRFNDTGVDFARSAISRARQRANAANVSIDFIVDDLTKLRQVVGPFDFLVDFGTFDDLDAGGRERYVTNVVPLAAANSTFLLWCFEWPMRWWERRIPFMPPALEAGEVERRFALYFTVDVLVATSTGRTGGRGKGRRGRAACRVRALQYRPGRRRLPLG